MRHTKTSYIASLIFVTLLLFKGIGTLAHSFSTFFTQTAALELLVDMEREKENKGPKGMEKEFNEDLFEKIHLFNYSFASAIAASTETFYLLASLQDVSLDTLTPPPNNRVC